MTVAPIGHNHPPATPLQVTPPKGSTIRQRRHREKLAEQGLCEITVRVPISESSDMKILAARLCADRDMMVGTPKNKKTGRMIKA